MISCFGLFQSLKQYSQNYCGFTPSPPNTNSATFLHHFDPSIGSALIEWLWRFVLYIYIVEKDGMSLSSLMDTRLSLCRMHTKSIPPPPQKKRCFLLCSKVYHYSSRDKCKSKSALSV